MNVKELNNIAINVGTVMNNNDDNFSKLIVPDEAIQLIEKTRNTNMQNNNELLPGQTISYTLDDNETIKNMAEDNLIQSAAAKKLHNELNKNLDARIKEYVVNSIIDAHKQEFFDKNGYTLTGKELRRTIKAVNTKMKCGKIKITPKQRQEIIDYLNLSSSDNSSETAQKTDNNPTSVSSFISSNYTHKI